MRILIYGAGAVGGYVGGHLAEAGEEIVLLTRPTAAEAITKRGLHLHGVDGKSRRVPVRAVTSAQEAFADGQAYDWIAFTMKAYDTTSAILELQAVQPQPPLILCLQNGLGNEETLAAAFGDECVVAGVVTTPVSISEPGIVVEEKRNGVAIATDNPASRTIVDALRRTALRVQTHDRTASLKWSKLLLNILGNATCAILDMTPAEVYADERLFQIEAVALREALEAMEALNLQPINLPGMPAFWLAALARLLPTEWLRSVLTPRVAQGRGGKMPSFHVDLSRGRGRSEVAWLNGAVVAAAEGVGLAAPVNHALALTLSDIVEGRTPWEFYRHRPDRLLAAVGVAR
jgi:2-dehydropantoate 2-reductase